MRKNISTSNLGQNLKILPIDVKKVSKVISIETDHIDTSEYSESLRLPTFGENRTKTFEAFRDPDFKIINANPHFQQINILIDKNAVTATPPNIGFSVQNSISNQKYSHQNDNVRHLEYVEPFKYIDHFNYIKAHPGPPKYVWPSKYIQPFSYTGSISDDSQSSLKYTTDFPISPEVLTQNYNFPQTNSFMSKYDAFPNGILPTQDINTNDNFRNDSPSRPKILNKSESKNELSNIERNMAARVGSSFMLKESPIQTKFPHEKFSKNKKSNISNPVINFYEDGIADAEIFNKRSNNFLFDPHQSKSLYSNNFERIPGKTGIPEKFLNNKYSKSSRSPSRKSGSNSPNLSSQISLNNFDVKTREETSPNDIIQKVENILDRIKDINISKKDKIYQLDQKTLNYDQTKLFVNFNASHFQKNSNQEYKSNNLNNNVDKKNHIKEFSPNFEPYDHETAAPSSFFDAYLTRKLVRANLVQSGSLEIDQKNLNFSKNSLRKNVGNISFIPDEATMNLDDSIKTLIYTTNSFQKPEESPENQNKKAKLEHFKQIPFCNLSSIKDNSISFNKENSSILEEGEDCISKKNGNKINS